MKRAKVEIPKSHENDWAYGCDKCKHGLIDAPERSGACELYLERLVQAIDGDLRFCECKAGVRYKVYLKNRLLTLRDEAKRYSRMASYAERKTHPDIESARQAMHSGFGYVKTPPIRWQADDYPVPDEAQTEVQAEVNA